MGIYDVGSGGNGGGFEGIFQGLQASQQKKANDQTMDDNKRKMDWLQTQQDRSNEDYEKNEMFGRMRNLIQTQKAGKDTSGIVSELNDFSKKSQNFSTFNMFNQGTDGFKNEDGSFKNEFLNQYKSETGKDFVPGGTDSANYIDSKGNQLMFSEDGNKPMMFDGDTFAAGSSNYRDFDKKKTLEEQLMKAKIAKELKGTGTVSDGASLAAIDDKIKAITDSGGTVPQNLLTQQAAAVEKAKLGKPRAIDALNSTEAREFLNTSMNGNVLEDSVIDNYMAQQSKAGVKYDKQADTTNKITGVTNLARTFDELDALTNSGESGGGWSQGVKSDILKKTSNKQFKAMNEDDQKMVLKNAIKNSQVLSRVFGIIKEDSGAAFTDEEFSKRLQALAGGDIDKINDATLMTTLGSYTDGKIKDIRTLVNNIDPSAKGSKLFLSNQLNKGIKGNGFLTDRSTPGGTKSADDTIKAVANEQTSDIMQTATGVVSGMSDALPGASDVVQKIIDKVLPTETSESELPEPTPDNVQGVFNTFSKLGEKLKQFGPQGEAILGELQTKLKNKVINEDEFKALVSEFVDDQPSTMGI